MCTSLLFNRLIDLLVTLVGVFSGFTLAIWWDRRKKKIEENKSRKLLCQRLIQDLEGNLKDLKLDKKEKFTIKLNDVELSPILPILENHTFQEAINTGKYSLIPLKMQKQISEVNTLIEIHTLGVTKLLEFTTSSAVSLTNAADILVWQVESIENTQKLLRENIPELINKLKKCIEDN